MNQNQDMRNSGVNKGSKWVKNLMVYILCIAITFTMTPVNLIAWGAEVADQETGKTQVEQTAGAAKVGTAAADNQSSNGETSTDTAKDSAAQATDEKSVAENSSDNNAAEQSSEGGKDSASGTDQSDQGQSGSSQSASAATVNNNDQSATGEKTGAADSDSATDAKAAESDKDSDSSDKDAEDKKDDEKFPAVSFEKSAGGVSVSIDAPEGALPEGVSVTVSAVSKSKVKAAAEKALGGEPEDIKAVDISFKDKDGKEIEPKKSVSVTMASELDAEGDVKVVHLADNGSASVVNAKVSGNTASFKSSEFSAFMLTATSDSKLTVHVTNILYTKSASEAGHAVVHEKTTTLIKGQSQGIAKYYNLVGGQSVSPQSGIGATYTFLKAFVVATSDSGLVLADSTPASSQTVKQIKYSPDGKTSIVLNDGSVRDMGEATDVYISPVYKVKYNWYLNYHYVDRISTGSGSWNNKDAVVEFKHIFSDPSEKTPVSDYKFVEWFNTDNGKHYRAGEESVYSSAQLKDGETKDVYVYAIWQPSVTINYYVNGKIAKTEKKFDSVTVNYTPDSQGKNITFAGWYDKDGKKVDGGTEYKAPALTGLSEDIVQPAVYDVYAKFTTTHTVTKKWNDANNMDGLRKDSVEVKLLANGEEVKDSDGNIMTVELSEENEWKFTFENLDAYDENNKLIAYTTEETTDLGNDYKASYDYDNIIDEVTGDVIRAIATFITNTLVPKVTIKAADGEWTYDGKAHTDSKVTKINGNLFPGDELVATATGSVTNVADSKKGNNIIEDGDFKIMRGDEDVTEMYNITREPGTLTIKKAPLTVTTSSASKTYDGKALTADAKVNGLVNGETVTVNATGSQTEVGSSKNTYRLSWNGTASESNYEITEQLGTLTITAAPSDDVDPDPGDNGGKDPSGGKTTPSDNPGRSGTGGNTPRAVNGGTTRTNGALTASTNTSSASTVSGNQNTDPAPQDLTEIEDQKTPLAKTQDKWALLNLILMILTVLLCLWMAAGTLRRNQDADRKEDEKTVKRKKILKLLSLIPAIAAVIAFILTEDMTLPMQMTDKWTILMLIIFVVQVVMRILTKNKKDEEDNNKNAYA